MAGLTWTATGKRQPRYATCDHHSANWEGERGGPQTDQIKSTGDAYIGSPRQYMIQCCNASKSNRAHPVLSGGSSLQQLLLQCFPHSSRSAKLLHLSLCHCQLLLCQQRLQETVPLTLYTQYTFHLRKESNMHHNFWQQSGIERIQTPETFVFTSVYIIPMLNHSIKSISLLFL